MLGGVLPVYSSDTVTTVTYSSSGRIAVICLGFCFPEIRSADLLVDLYAGWTLLLLLGNDRKYRARGLLSNAINRNETEILPFCR